MDLLRSRSKSGERKKNNTPPANSDELGAIAKLPANLAEKAGEKLELKITEGGQKILDEVVKDREKLEREKERDRRDRGRDRERDRERDRSREPDDIKNVIYNLSEKINNFLPEINKRLLLLEKNREWDKEREKERERDRANGRLISQVLSNEQKSPAHGTHSFSRGGSEETTFLYNINIQNTEEEDERNIETDMLIERCDGTTKEVLNCLMERMKNIEKESRLGGVKSIAVDHLKKVNPPNTLSDYSKHDKNATNQINEKTINALKRSTDTVYDQDRTIMADWLERMAESVEANGVKLNHTQYRILLLTFLPETMRSIVNHTPGVKEMNAQEFHNYLCIQFPDPISMEDRVRNFYNFKQENSPKIKTMNDLLQHVKVLGREANVGVGEVNKLIVSNLPAFAQSRLDTIRGSQPWSNIRPEMISVMLAEKIGMINRYLSQGKRDQKKVNKVVEEYEDDSSDEFPLTAGVNKLDISQSTREGQTGQREKKKIDMKDGRMFCYKCLRVGHTKEYCRVSVRCALCNSSSHIPPECTIYKGCVAVDKSCDQCKKVFSLELKHTAENCVLNPNSPFRIPLN